MSVALFWTCSVLRPSCAGGPRPGCSTPSGASQGQSRGGQSEDSLVSERNVVFRDYDNTDHINLLSNEKGKKNHLMLVFDSFDIYNAQCLEAVLKGFGWSFKEFPTDASKCLNKLFKRLQ